MADLEDRETHSQCLIDQINFTHHNVLLLVPFNNPDETEEEVPYGGQQVCQRQIISDAWKVDFVNLVVAIEKIGLFQKALQVQHS